MPLPKIIEKSGKVIEVKPRVITLAKKIFQHITIIKNRLTDIRGLLGLEKEIIMVRNFCNELEKEEEMIFYELKSEEFYRQVFSVKLKQATILEDEFIVKLKALKDVTWKNIRAGEAKTQMGVAINNALRIVDELNHIRKLLKTEQRTI